MTILETLRRKIAPELNLLYTVPPHSVGDIIDCGWSCREHALHVRVLCALFGVSGDLCFGEFMVDSAFLPRITSGGAGDCHAWCRVKDVIPVDLSMTFAHYGIKPQLDGPVFGAGKNGDYAIVYRRAEEPLGQRPQVPHCIIFREHKTVDHAPDALTQNPYLFIYPPAHSNQTNWDAMFGPEIYARITAHCFAVATRKANPLSRAMNSQGAIRWISNNYPSATNEIISKLTNAT